ncbi:hypothetical protein BHM03_00018917, partial [Ensete ventricosum]
MLEGSPLPRAQWPAGGEVSPSTSGSSWSDLGWSSGRSFSCFPPCFSFPTSPLLFSPEATRVKAHGQRSLRPFISGNSYDNEDGKDDSESSHGVGNMPTEESQQRQRAASNPSAMLAALVSKRDKLQDELRVYDLETTYLQDSNQNGSVLKGFEGFLSSSKGTAKSILMGTCWPEFGPVQLRVEEHVAGRD